MSQTPLQRINRVQRFYYNRGICKNSVDSVYYKILYNKHKITNNFVSLYKSAKI